MVEEAPMLRISRALMVVVSLAALLALSAVSGPALRAQSVDDIITSHFQAMGGLEKWRAITTMKLTGHVVVQGLEAPMTIYSKRPNLARQEINIQGQKIVNAFDGTTAWMANPLTGSSAPVTMSGPEAALIKDQSDFDEPLIDHQAKGFMVELVGIEPVGTQKAYHVKITRKLLPTQHFYLDTTSYMVVRIVTDMGAGPKLETELGRYRAVDGIMVPTSMKSLANGMETSDISIDTVEFNVPMDAALFRAPGKVPATPKPEA
jgi:outer membrane lipoprotein-sorting protein